VTYLRETRAKPDSDLFWASAVDAFQTLKQDGLLDKVSLPKEVAARIPAKIGDFPIHDPDGFYFGFAVSGYGLMWNARYLAAHKLAAPREWVDLADPRTTATS
jgi:ABC-type Fe3+ transport system substrate-binding protein